MVVPSSKGDFTTIQAAIDSIPSNNQIWTMIDIKAGVYIQNQLEMSLSSNSHI